MFLFPRSPKVPVDQTWLAESHIAHPCEFPDTPTYASPLATSDNALSLSPTASLLSLTVSTCYYTIPIYYATYCIYIIEIALMSRIQI
jgi:hypothetical protein